MATSKMQMKQPVLVYDEQRSHEDNTFFTYVGVKAWKCDGVAYLNFNLHSNEMGDNVTLPNVSLPASIIPSIARHYALTTRYQEKVTTVNIGTNGQITIDHLTASVWYNADVSYVI